MTPAWIRDELVRIADLLASARTRADSAVPAYQGRTDYPSIAGFLAADCTAAAIELRALLGALEGTR